MKKTTLGILASLLISMTAQAELVNLDFENQYCDAGEESKSFGIVTFSKTKEEGAFFCAQQGPISNMPESPGVGLLYGASSADFNMDAGGTPFDLISFDAASRLVYSTHLVNEIVLTGTFSYGGSITTTFLMDGEEPGTFSLTGFNNLSSVRMVATGDGERPQFVLDNVLVNTYSSFNLANVSSPAAISMLSICALGAFSLRKKRRI